MHSGKRGNSRKIRLPSDVMIDLATMMHSWRRQLQTGELQAK